MTRYSFVNIFMLQKYDGWWLSQVDWVEVISFYFIRSYCGYVRVTFIILHLKGGCVTFRVRSPSNQHYLLTCMTNFRDERKYIRVMDKAQSNQRPPSESPQIVDYICQQLRVIKKTYILNVNSVEIFRLSYVEKPIMHCNFNNNLIFFNISVVCLACKCTHRVLCLWLNWLKCL